MHPPGKSVPAVVIFVIRVESVQRWTLSAFSYRRISHRAPVPGLPGSSCGRGVPDSSMAEYRAGHASLFMMENTGGRAASPRGV